MTTSDFFKYEKETWTLAKIMQNENLEFPFAAKTCFEDMDFIKAFHSDLSLLENKEILFQRRFKCNFARMKVLPFCDNEAMKRKHGSEYVQDRETYVGEEFLLPTSFRGKFHRLFERFGNYTELSQIAEDNSDQTTDAIDSRKSINAGAKPNLLFRGKISDPQEPEKSVDMCSNGKTEIVSRDNSPAKCTTVQKTCRLNDLCKCHFSPKVIQFVTKVKEEETVLNDCEMNSAMIGFLEGPLEITSIEKREFVIGSVRNKKLRTFETLLIPEYLWGFISLKKKRFHVDSDKESYIAGKFGEYCETDFVERSVYIVPVDNFKILWLVNPSLRRRDNENNPYQIIDVPFIESSDDEAESNSSEYDVISDSDISPPIPKRIPRSTQDECSNIKRKHSNMLEKLWSIPQWLLKKTSRRSVSEFDCPPKIPPKPHLRRSVSHLGISTPSWFKRPLAGSWFDRKISSKFSTSAEPALDHDLSARLSQSSVASQNEYSLPDREPNVNPYSPLVYDGMDQDYERTDPGLLKEIFQELSMQETPENVHDPKEREEELFHVASQEQSGFLVPVSEKVANTDSRSFSVKEDNGSSYYERLNNCWSNVTLQPGENVEENIDTSESKSNKEDFEDAGDYEEMSNMYPTQDFLYNGKK